MRFIFFWNYAWTPSQSNSWAAPAAARNLRWTILCQTPTPTETLALQLRGWCKATCCTRILGNLKRGKWNPDSHLASFDILKIHPAGPLSSKPEVHAPLRLRSWKIVSFRLFGKWENPNTPSVASETLPNYSGMMVLGSQEVESAVHEY